MTAAPLVISHRTNMGTMPENSLAGIRAALADRADGVEVDVRATSDGVPVLLHDESPERVGGATYPISEMTLAAARATPLDGRATSGVPAHVVPTLREALAAVNGSARLVIEVKAPGIEDAVSAEIERARARDWCWIWAFDPAVAWACRERMPGIPVALNTSPGAAARLGYGSPIVAAVERELAAISVSHGTLTARLVSEAKAAGLAVYTWTVNEPADIERVMDAGVDAVCGDFPGRIRSLIPG